MSIDSEFIRNIYLNKITNANFISNYLIKASEEECSKLASRFNLIKLEKLEATFCINLWSEAKSYAIKGVIESIVIQECIITLKEIRNKLYFPIEIILLPKSHKLLHSDYITNNHIDYEPINSNVVNLGEIAAQYLSIAIDPYPKSLLK